LEPVDASASGRAGEEYRNLAGIRRHANGPTPISQLENAQSEVQQAVEQLWPFVSKVANNAKLC
jgi:hypothetical protein